MGNHTSDLLTKLKAIPRTNAYISLDISEKFFISKRLSSLKCYEMGGL